MEFNLVISRDLLLGCHLVLDADLVAVRTRRPEAHRAMTAKPGLR
jgi:hypothetical protein